MGQLKKDCPHCGTKNTAFNAFGETGIAGSQRYITAFYCCGCYGGIIAEIKLIAGNSPVQYHGDIEANPNLKVTKIYPLEIENETPKYLPENIKNFYLQAAHNLLAQNYDASAMMSRKVLEVAVKKLDPDHTGNLYNRIESLESKNIITSDLKDWAHIIRGDGNFAAHEEEPVTLEFAQELLSFTEAFLMYTFTMPELIKEKRSNNTKKTA